MRWARILGALALSAGCLIGQSALADDWQVATVSGSAYRLEGKAWVRVAANDQIALGQMVKTLGSGALTLRRAGITVDVAPNSRIQLSERPQGKVTEVLQAAGSAEVEVDPTKHIRLTVETPYMAAVVKGTVFTVATHGDRSETFVKRGRVAVFDVKNRLTADVTQGQTATSGPSQKLALSGVGTLEAPKPFKGPVYSRSIESALTKMTSAAETTDKTDTAASDTATAGSDKASSSDAGNGSSGSSNAGSGTAGNSDNSNAGGSTSNSNAGGTSNNSSAGGSSGNSNAGGSSGSGHSGHGNGSGGGGDHGGGNSGHGGGHSGHGGGWH